MPAPDHAVSLEEQIDQWRSYLRRRQAIQPNDITELEDHLREQVAGLADSGLTTDEAFLVAVKRMGDLDTLSREFAREHSDRLWKQLVVAAPDSGEAIPRARTDAVVAFCLAVGAAVAIKLPAAFGIQLNQDTGFYVRNLGLFVLPLLTGYFVWKRRMGAGMIRRLAVAFVVAGVFANIYPLVPDGYTEVLSALHLPIVLWLLVGVAYA
ncbi:MAG: permease prefix domain 1-containing protein, partial [Gemmatimonadota bacterium]|nr:permease prefix domain 1-containing protein [Gemmatimonadota bacterium]